MGWEYGIGGSHPGREVALEEGKSSQAELDTLALGHLNNTEGVCLWFGHLKGPECLFLIVWYGWTVVWEKWRKAIPQPQITW